MQIIALNDTNDPSFLADEQTAINIYQSLYSTDYITVTIRVGYGDWNGQPLPDQSKSEGDVNIAAVQILDYATLRKDLLTYGMKPAFFNNTNLPPPGAFVGPDGTRTPPNFWVSSSVAKIFGLPTNGAVDGSIGIGTGFAPGPARVCAFLHEIGHALGRVPENTISPLNGLTAYSELDLWRFTSQGNRLWDGNTSTAPAAYFSLDGGATRLADWGQTSDPSDFRGPDSNPASNLTPNDPFNENDSNSTDLTSADFGVMDALGFTTTVIVPPNPDPPVAGITDPHPKVKIEGASNQRFFGPSLSASAGGHLPPNGSVLPVSQDEDLSRFKGTVAGLHCGNATDFADIGFGANSTLGHRGSSVDSDNILPASDGAQIAKIALLGSYMTSTFVAAGEGHGGTLISAGTTSSDQPQIAPPPHHWGGA